MWLCEERGQTQHDFNGCQHGKPKPDSGDTPSCQCVWTCACACVPRGKHYNEGRMKFKNTLWTMRKVCAGLYMTFVFYWVHLTIVCIYETCCRVFVCYVVKLMHASVSTCETHAGNFRMHCSKKSWFILTSNICIFYHWHRSCKWRLKPFTDLCVITWRQPSHHSLMLPREPVTVSTGLLSSNFRHMR